MHRQDNGPSCRSSDDRNHWQCEHQVQPQPGALLLRASEDRSDQAISAGTNAISVEDSADGVWVDGIALSVLKRKRASAALGDSGLSTSGSLPEAAALTYGTIEQPLLDRSQTQPPVDASSNWVLSEPGPFWLKPEPVAQAIQHP
jgi:hypothetical protein